MKTLLCLIYCCACGISVRAQTSDLTQPESKPSKSRVLLLLCAGATQVLDDDPYYLLNRRWNLTYGVSALWSKPTSAEQRHGVMLGVEGFRREYDYTNSDGKRRLHDLTLQVPVLYSYRVSQQPTGSDAATVNGLEFFAGPTLNVLLNRTAFETDSVTKRTNRSRTSLGYTMIGLTAGLAYTAHTKGGTRHYFGLRTTQEFGKALGRKDKVIAQPFVSLALFYNILSFSD